MTEHRLKINFFKNLHVEVWWRERQKRNKRSNYFCAKTFRFLRIANELKSTRVNNTVCSKRRNSACIIALTVVFIKVWFHEHFTSANSCMRSKDKLGFLLTEVVEVSSTHWSSTSQFYSLKSYKSVPLTEVVQVSSTHWSSTSQFYSLK